MKSKEIFMKKIVAFFSATGTTKKLATNLANVLNCDLFEIKPKKAYTEEDLDWTNKKSRSSIEMQNPSSRPEIANKIENIDEYDTIFLGFPIWWYVAPTIINAFLEQYDLKGKKVVPFATSGSSSMGNTNNALKNSCPGALLMEGKRFGSNASLTDLKLWAEKF